MRLLNVESKRLETFTKNAPLYAILSHTWDADQEVTFQMMQGSDLGYQQLSGWAKIQDCCKQARSEGWKYVWIDTCCIDKTNSAELSEAINSMFRWYKEAGTCYAYLSDISGKFGFQSSRWFTRGWTLQELIAPRFVFFFDQGWTLIGSRDSLLAKISLSTGIRVDYLRGHNYFRKAPVSEIFYWASQRKTERIEDEAYSLLGLFGIHMPLIYGEREMAFRRLQMAIIQERNDETIFAWLFGELQDSELRLPDFFASSTSKFRNCGSFLPKKHIHRRPGFSMSNEGLRMHGRVYKRYSRRVQGLSEYILPLSIAKEGPGSDPSDSYLISMNAKPGTGEQDTYYPLQPFIGTLTAIRSHDNSKHDHYTLDGKRDRHANIVLLEDADFLCKFSSAKSGTEEDELPINVSFDFSPCLEARGLHKSKTSLRFFNYNKDTRMLEDAPHTHSRYTIDDDDESLSYVHVPPYYGRCDAFIASLCIPNQGKPLFFVVKLHWDDQSELPECDMRAAVPGESVQASVSQAVNEMQANLAQENPRKLYLCYREYTLTLLTHISPRSDGNGTLLHLRIVVDDASKPLV